MSVQLTDKAAEVIERAIKFPLKTKGIDLLFFGDTGRNGERKPYTINRVWTKASKQAEIENLRFQDLLIHVIDLIFGERSNVKLHANKIKDFH